MRKNKLLIIVIIIISLILIIGGCLTYLYIATDFLKSNKDLFNKYIAQNIDKFNEIKNSATSNFYEDLKNEPTYESTTTLGMNYSEGGEVSNPLNDLSIQLKTQKEDEYLYRNAKILYKDQAYLGIEGLKEGNVYGLRFLGVANAFLSVRNNQEVMIPDSLELNKELVQQCIAVIDGNTDYLNEIISKEDLQTLKDRYSAIILKSIGEATFSSQRNSMITINNNTIKANAYIATLEQNQVQSLIEEILETIKSDEIILSKIEDIGLIDVEEFTKSIDEEIENLGIDKEIPTIKITVYEQKGITIRTVIEIGMQKITIENETSKIKIQRSVSSDEPQEQTIEIVKTGSENEENYDITLEILEGENNYNFEFNLNMVNQGDTITTTGELGYKEGIKDIALTIENVVNKAEFGEKIVSDTTNNIILNDLEEEQQKYIYNLVKDAVIQIIPARWEELLSNLQLADLIKNLEDNMNNVLNQNQPENPNIDPSEFEEPQLSQIEINRFNAKFEFYTGESVTAQNVKALLEVVKSNLESVEITPIEDPTVTNPEDIKENIKIFIEKDKENTDLANGIISKIKDDKKYDVDISYKAENEMIDYITIKEAE